MSTLNWLGEPAKAKVRKAVVAAIDTTTAEAVAVARQLNRERAFKTGTMTDGWYQVKAISTVGAVVSGGFGNSVYYAIFVDRGTIYITPRNISNDAMDQVFPTLAAHIAAELG